jgi:hypothetical protein
LATQLQDFGGFWAVFLGWPQADFRKQSLTGGFIQRNVMANQPQDSVCPAVAAWITLKKYGRTMGADGKSLAGLSNPLMQPGRHLHQSLSGSQASLQTDGQRKMYMHL